MLEYSHVYLGYVGLAASYIGGVLAPPQLMDFYLPISQMYQIPFYQYACGPPRWMGHQQS